jgi:hypothetical protein
MLVSIRGHFSGSSQLAVPAGVPLSENSSSNWCSPKAPWGRLECQSITMERPEEFVPELPAIAIEPFWFFGNWTSSQIATLFGASDLTSAQHDALLDTNRWRENTNGWTIIPGTNIAWSLSRSARQQIYQVLAQFPENSPQCVPYRFPLAHEEEWFMNSGLASNTVKLAHSLIYRRGQSACFSDVEVLSILPSEAERHRLVRTLSRFPAVFVNLHVDSNTVLEPIIQFWEQTRPRQDTQPFLESLTRLPGSPAINITYFLPPFARTRIYTFPEGKLDNQNSGEDCFWTAMNFFNRPPDNRLADPQQRMQLLSKNYSEIKGNPNLGDIILLLDKNQMPIHACVYIAQDVVFTKNGGTRLSPWLLMRIADMLSYYMDVQPLRLAIMRQKGRKPPRASINTLDSIKRDMQSSAAAANP